MSSCETCKYNNEPWQGEHCDGCTMGGDTCNYEPMSDLISRAEALDRLIEYNNSFGTGHDTDKILKCIEIVNHAPSVEPSQEDLHREREQAYLQGYEQGQSVMRSKAYAEGYEQGRFDSRQEGEWIDKRDMDFTCSVCGCMATADFIDEFTGKPTMNFCPECGARMRGSE